MSIFKSVFGGKGGESEKPADFYEPERVRLFIKSYCPWCHKAMNWLDDHHVQYEVLDVLKDDAAYAEMEKLSGQSMTPTIEVDGKVLGDFGPDELARFWKTLGEKTAE